MATLTFSWDDGSRDHFYVDTGLSTGNGQLSITSDVNNSSTTRSASV